MEQSTQTTSIFDVVIWSGASLTLVGLLLLVYCIVRVAKARRANLPDAELRAAVQKVVPLNLGALCLSVLGLMMVIVGISMG